MTINDRELDNKLKDLHLYIDEEDTKLTMNEKEQAEILDSVIKKINMQKQCSDEKNVKRYWKMKNKYTRVAVAVLGVFLIGSTITIGAKTLLMNTPIARYFGVEAMDGGAKKEKLVNDAKKMIQSLSVSDTQKGLTVSINQAFGDDNACYLAMNVKGLNDIKDFDSLVETGTFKDINANIADKTIIQTSIHDEGREDDDSNNYLMILECEDIKGSHVSLELKDFGYYANDKFIPVVEGSWKLDWDLSYDSAPQKYDVNQKINIYGSEAVWDNLTLTPISASVSLTMTKENAAELTDGVDANDELYVDFADGSRISSRFAEDDAIYNDTTKISLYFSQIKDIDDIVSVTFAGKTFPIHEDKAPHKNVYTNDKMKFSLSFSDEMYKLLDISDTIEYKDEYFKSNAQKVNFVMKKNNTEMTFATIFRVKGMWSKEEAEDINPLVTYVDYYDGYTYFLEYGEIVEEAQAKAFDKVLNNEPNLLHLITFTK